MDQNETNPTTRALEIILNERARIHAAAMSGDGVRFRQAVTLADQRRRRALEDAMDADTEQYDDSDDELAAFDEDSDEFDDTDDINDENSEAKRLHRQRQDMRARQGLYLDDTADEGFDPDAFAEGMQNAMNAADRMRRGAGTGSDQEMLEALASGTPPTSPDLRWPNTKMGRQPDAATYNGLVRLDPAAGKHVYQRRV